MKKNTNLFVVILSLILCIVFLTGCKQQNPVTKPTPPQIETKDGVKTYINPKHNYSFTVCNNEEFEIEESSEKNNVALLGPRLNDFKRRINISVVVGVLPPNISFENYLKNTTKEAEKNLAKFAVTDESNITVDGITANKTSFTYFEHIGDQDYTFKNILIIFMKGNVVYAIKYDVPEDFHDENVDCFNTLVSTFKFRS